MHHEIDLSGESPALVGAPLATLPLGIRRLAQSDLDDLSTALNPPGEWAGRAFWPIVDEPATPEAWEELAAEPTYEIDAEARQVRAVRAAVDRDLAAVKATKCAAIDAERDARYAGGVAFTFPGDVAGIIQTRPGTDDLVTIAGLSTRAAVLVMQADTETTIQLTDAGNVRHFLTGPQFLALGIAVADARTAIHNAARDKKDAVNALTTAAEVWAYDATTGWPDDPEPEPEPE